MIAGMKKVISFRLSDDELADLDAVCAKLRLSRGEAVVKGIHVLAAEYVRKGGSIERDSPWIQGGPDAEA